MNKQKYFQGCYYKCFKPTCKVDNNFFLHNKTAFLKQNKILILKKYKTIYTLKSIEIQLVFKLCINCLLYKLPKQVLLLEQKLLSCLSFC